MFQFEFYSSFLTCTYGLFYSYSPLAYTAFFAVFIISVCEQRDKNLELKFEIKAYLLLSQLNLILRKKIHAKKLELSKKI